MNKPPEKIRVVVSKNGKAILDDCDQWSIAKWGRNRPEEAPFTEHFYTLEKPMTQKTENLTKEEAWAAMARGECVRCELAVVQTIQDNVLKYWNGADWRQTCNLLPGPYSIVPDPSKPKEVESNYQEQVMAIDTMLKRGEYKNAAACILTYVDSLYLRKP